MKTTYSPEKVTSFLGSIEAALPDSLVQLTEGHISQAFSFEKEQGDKYVLRISARQEDFVADKYAADNFGTSLLVPKVTDIGQFEESAYYCISRFVEGTPSNLVSEQELAAALPNIQNTLAKIYQFDVSTSTGYGHLNTTTGNAKHNSWKEAIGQEIEQAGLQSFRDSAAKIGLDPEIADKFIAQFRKNLPYASEVRRLLHGDPAFDNMLIKNGRVTAIIDWSSMGYGDWMSDFAYLGFWWPGRYGDAKTFARTYGLEDDHIEERLALYWATNALRTIAFADNAKSEAVGNWLKFFVSSKLV
jgi:hygromycin-B 4-O-kinase